MSSLLLWFISTVSEYSGRPEFGEVDLKKMNSSKLKSTMMEWNAVRWMNDKEGGCRLHLQATTKSRRKYVSGKIILMTIIMCYYTGAKVIG